MLPGNVNGPLTVISNCPEVAVMPLMSVAMISYRPEWLTRMPLLAINICVAESIDNAAGTVAPSGEMR